MSSRNFSHSTKSSSSCPSIPINSSKVGKAFRYVCSCVVSCPGLMSPLRSCTFGMASLLRPFEHEFFQSNPVLCPSYLCTALPTLLRRCSTWPHPLRRSGPASLSWTQTRTWMGSCRAVRGFLSTAALRMTSTGADSTSFTSVSLPERFDFAFPRADPPPLAVWERRQEQIHPLLQTHPRGSRGRTRERRGCAMRSGRGAEGKAVPRTVDWKGVDPVRRGLKGGSSGFEPGFDRMEKEHDTLASVEPRPSRKDAPFSRSFSLPASPEDRGVDRPPVCQGGLGRIEGPSHSPSSRRCESEGHVRIVRGGKGRGTTNRVDSIPERTRERERRVDQVRSERENEERGMGERCHVDPRAWEGTKGKGKWKSLQGDVERALE